MTVKASDRQRARLKKANEAFAKSERERPSTLAKALYNHSALIPDDQRQHISPLGGVAREDKRR
jgi:hypothetical protein